jgi:DNA repair protein RecO (recombination protein O)
MIRSPHEGEPGYVLHTYPFKETSLVVEAFTREHGRVGLVAKGARRRGSVLRGVLMAFQPLLLAWSGKSELKLLQRAEWQGGHRQLAGLALICGFYLNELLLRLTARDDPHPGLYADYERALAALREAPAPGPALRRFERGMLAELGYGLQLTRDANGAALADQREYLYVVERGAVPVEDMHEQSDAPRVSGHVLLRIARDDYSEPATLQQARALMRHAINHHLGGKPLHSRQLLVDVQQL